MGRWGIALAFLLPAAAQAAPPISPRPLPMKPIPMRQIVYAPSASSSAFHALAAGTMAHVSSGWGLRATLDGRSMDLGARDFNWAEDTVAGSRDMEAGFGWRGANSDALFGYSRHEIGPAPDHGPGRSGSAFPTGPRWHAPSVLGFSFILRTR